MAASLFAGSITSNLKFTAKVPLLMKATSNDEKPTQGYNLQEISRISKSSLPNCQSLLTFLLGRLEKKDPRIKFKVLHLMKYLVINGHSEFRAQLRHNAEAVKKTVNFQGELDPVHGDGLNLKVQQAASELEKLLFDVDNPEIESIYKSMLAPDQSGKKMQGFGYTGAPEIKKEPSFMDTLMQVKKSGSKIFNMNKATPKGPPNEYEQLSAASQAQYTPVDLEDSEVHSSSNFSSVDGNDEDEICDENEMNSDHYYERKSVQNITAEGGLAKIPSKEMLKDFVNKSSSLEIPVILEILDGRLQSQSPNVQLKSLCVVEYMLRSNLSNIPREINEHCPSIHLLAESQDLTVQAKANKIVLAIASCLKQDENQAASGAQVVVPPSYNEAKEIPRMKDRSSSETEHKVAKETDFNSLFSGMNLSTGARPDSAANQVETTESLIDIENTAATTLLENSDFSTTPDTNKSNSKQNPTENDKQTSGKASNLFSSKHTNREVYANQFASAASSEAQNYNNFDLMSLETSGTSILDFSTPLQNRDLSLLESDELKSNSNVHEIVQETDKKALGQEADKGRIIFNPKEAIGQISEGSNINNKTTARHGVLNSNNVDLLSRVNSTQNTENLLLLNTEQHNPNPLTGLPQKASHINPNRTVQCIPQNPNSDLLTFQPEPRSQALPGGLVLPTNSSSASPRRPFPKDMKSETDGFDFIRKSTNADAFSFINDEIQASKTKQK